MRDDARREATSADSEAAQATADELPLDPPPPRPGYTWVKVAEAARLFGKSEETIRRGVKRVPPRWRGVDTHRGQGKVTWIEVLANEITDPPPADASLVESEAAETAATRRLDELLVSVLAERERERDRRLDEAGREIRCLSAKLARAIAERDLALAQLDVPWWKRAWSLMRGTHLWPTPAAGQGAAPPGAAGAQPLVGPQGGPKVVEVGGRTEAAAGSSPAEAGGVGDTMPDAATTAAAEYPGLVVH